MILKEASGGVGGEEGRKGRQVVRVRRGTSTAGRARGSWVVVDAESPFC